MWPNKPFQMNLPLIPSTYSFRGMPGDHTLCNDDVDTVNAENKQMSTKIMVGGKSSTQPNACVADIHLSSPVMEQDLVEPAAISAAKMAATSAVKRVRFILPPKPEPPLRGSPLFEEDQRLHPIDENYGYRYYFVGPELCTTPIFCDSPTLSKFHHYGPVDRLGPPPRALTGHILQLIQVGRWRRFRLNAEALLNQAALRSNLCATPVRITRHVNFVDQSARELPAPEEETPMYVPEPPPDEPTFSVRITVTLPQRYHGSVSITTLARHMRQAFRVVMSCDVARNISYPSVVPDFDIVYDSNLDVIDSHVGIQTVSYDETVWPMRFIDTTLYRQIVTLFSETIPRSSCQNRATWYVLTGITKFQSTWYTVPPVDQSKKEKKKQVREEHCVGRCDSFQVIQRKVLNLEKNVITPDMEVREKDRKINRLNLLIAELSELIKRETNHQPYRGRLRDESRPEINISECDEFSVEYETLTAESEYSFEDVLEDQVENFGGLFGNRVAVQNIMHALDGIPGGTRVDKVRVMLQMGMWAREFVQSKSIVDFCAKLILCSSHFFPEVVNTLLLSISKCFVNESSDANWFSDLNVKFANVRKIPIVKHVKRLVLAVSAGLILRTQLDGDMGKILTSLLNDGEKEVEKFTPLDVLDYFTQAMQFFIRVTVECVHTRSLRALLDYRSEEEKFEQGVIETSAAYDELINMGENNGSTEAFHELNNKLMVLRQAGTRLMNSSRLGGPVAMRILLTQIQSKISFLKHQINGEQGRIKPWACLFIGPPSAGKTSFYKLLLANLGAGTELNVDPTNVCNANLNDKHLNTYHGQEIMIADDLGQDQLASRANVGVTLIDIINVTPIPAVKADIPSKGNVFIDLKCFIGSSQKRHFAQDLVLDPAAVYRRFNVMIEPKPLPEYSTGGALDPKKIPAGVTEIITINLIEPKAMGLDDRGNQRLKDVYVTHDFGRGPEACSNLTIREAVEVLVYLYEQHHSSEVEKRDAQQAVSVCEHNRLVTCCLQCKPVELSPMQIAERKSRIDAAYYFSKPRGQETGQPTFTVSNEASTPFPMFLYSFVLMYCWITSWSIVAMFWNTYLSLPHIKFGLKLFANENAYKWVFSYGSAPLARLFVPVLCTALMASLPAFLFASWFSGFVTLFLNVASLFPAVCQDAVMYKLKHLPLVTLKKLHFTWKEWVAGKKFNYRFAIAVASVFGVAGYFLYNKMMEVRNEASLSELNEPRPENWVKPVVAKHILTNNQNLQKEDLLGLYSKKMVIVRTELGATCIASPIVGNFYVMPYHFVSEFVGRTLVCSFQSTGTTGDRYHVVLGAEGIAFVRVPDTDLAVCSLLLPPQRDFLRAYPKENIEESALIGVGFAMPYKRISEDVFSEGLIYGKCNGYAPCVSSSDASVNYVGIDAKVTTRTFEGMCGVPAVTLGSTPLVIGHHLQGGWLCARLGPVTQSELRLAMTQLSSNYTCGTRMTESTAPIIGGITPTVHPKNPLSFTENLSNIALLGTASSLRQRKPNFNAQQTSIYQQVKDQFGVEDVWGPPPRPSYHVKSKFLNNVGKPVLFDPNVIERAARDFADHILSFMDRDGLDLSNVRPLTDHETVRGIPGKMGFEPMQLSTSKGLQGLMSEGIDNFGSKRDCIWLEPHPEKAGEYIPFMSEEIKKAIASTEERMLGGELPGWIASMNYKDEIVKGGKMARAFWAVPVEGVFLSRKYELGPLAFIREHPLVFEQAVGVVSSGESWNQMHIFLNQEKPGDPLDDPDKENKLAIDYQAFDQRIQAVIQLATAYILLGIANKSGNYRPDQLKILEAILFQSVFPRYEIDCDIYDVVRSMWSGFTDTVQRNGFNNSIMLRYFFFTIYPEKERFRDYVKIMTYGDDVAGRVSDEVPEFNQKRISIEAAKIGLVITDDTKLSMDAAPEFTTTNKMTFLKRNFTFNEDLGISVGVLDAKSSLKSLLWQVRSRDAGVSSNMQLAGAINSATDEFFLRGREGFNSFHDRILKIILGTELEVLLPDRFFSTYDMRVAAWHEQYDLCVKKVMLNQSSRDVSHGVRVRALGPTTQVKLNDELSYWLPRVSPSYEESRICGGLRQLTKDLLAGLNNSTGYRENTRVTEFTSTNQITEQIQSVSFQDGGLSTAVAYDGSMANETDFNASDEVGMGKFLERPVKIASLVWTPQVVFTGLTINPWTLFLENKRVINRINNFFTLTGQLRVKIVINGNPFYYGRMMVDYQPIPSYDLSATVGLTNDLNRTGASQRLHLLLDPTTSTGGEMTLPFMWLNDKVKISNAEWRSLGVLHFRNFNTLQHANNATTPIDISVFAWMEGAELYHLDPGNATGLINQSSDEYGKSKFSETASNLAKHLSEASDAPVIGKYARASSLAVGAVAQLAGRAGFSRPPDDDAMPVRKRTISNLVNCDARDGSTKLSVDSKQELSVGSEILNLKTSDEMDLRTIAAKQAYIGTAAWDLSHGVNDVLLSACVQPNVFATETTTPTTFCVPPCMFTAMPFKYWRGKLHYRLQVVASAYHRGRLLVTWSPSSTAGNEVNVVRSMIIDLDKDRDVSFEIPWAASQSYLQLGVVSTIDKGWVANGGVAVPNSNFANGVITVYVLNTLAVPNSTTAATACSINWFVSMREAEFAQPDDSIVTNILYTNQSSQEPEIKVPEVQEGEATESNPIAESVPMPETIDHMYMGERVTSIRTLIKRFALHSIDLVALPTANKQYYVQSIQSTFPKYPGTVVNGDYTGVNYCRGLFLTYFVPAFLATRGGVRHKLVAQGLKNLVNLTHFAVVRRSSSTISGITVTDVTTTTATQQALHTSGMFAYGGHGCDATNTIQQNAIEVEFPFQRNRRFAAARTRSNYNAQGPVYEHYNYQYLTSSSSAGADSHVILKFIAAGEDFSMILFQGCPAFTLGSTSVP